MFSVIVVLISQITSSGLETSEIVFLIKNERKEDIILITLSWWIVPIESNVHALLDAWVKLLC